MKKLSEYTIATNCADIVDCQDGVAEIREEIGRRYEKKQDVPLYFYSRLDKLEKKLEKLAMKNYGMSYNEAVIKFGYDNLRGMGKTNDKEKIATALTITIFEKTSTSHRVGLPRTCKRRSTTTKPRLVYTKRDVLSGANINNFADKTKLFELINNFNIDDAEAFIKAIGKCFPQQEEKEHRLKASFDSKYQILDFSEFGVKVLLRVSDHNINAFNIQDDIDEAYSLVVKDRKSKNTFVNRDDITIREYVYWEENCNRDRYLKIVQNIYKFLETSEWDEDYVKADATNPPATEGLGDYPITHDVGDIVAAPEYNKIFLVVEVDSRNDRPTFFRAMNTDRRDRETIYKFTFNDDRIERCYAYSVNKPKFKIGAITNAGQIVDLKILPDFKKDNREIKAYYSYKILKDGGKYSYYDEDVLREIAPNIAPQTEESKYKVGDRVRFYYVADEYEGIIVRKEGEIFIVKVPYGDGYRLRSASYKDIISISTDSKSLFQFAQLLSSRFDDGESYDWAKVQKMAKELGVKSTQQELMQACELAVVLSARQIAHNGQSIAQRFAAMKDLYGQQVTVRPLDTQSKILQQYSTPCPLAFLLGVFVDKNDQFWNGRILEPSAGNGLLTVALHESQTVVNEIDEIRVANLKQLGFASVTSEDASSESAMQKFGNKFRGIITNPPFAKLADKDKIERHGWPINTLDYKMAVLALDRMSDNGKAAIIVGGKMWNSYWKPLSERSEKQVLFGQWKTFLGYLYAQYNVVDVIYINGENIYRKQGTTYPIVAILVDGRHEYDESVKPNYVFDSERDVIIDTFDQLLERIMPHLDPNRHDEAPAISLLKAKFGKNVRPSDYEATGDNPIHAYKYPTGTMYADTRFQLHDSNGWDFLPVVFKYDNGTMNVKCNVLPEYEQLIDRLKNDDARKRLAKAKAKALLILAFKMKMAEAVVEEKQVQYKHLTESDVAILLNLGYSHDRNGDKEILQIDDCIDYATFSIWKIINGDESDEDNARETTFEKACKLVGRDIVLSGCGRAAFHGWSGGVYREGNGYGLRIRIPKSYWTGGVSGTDSYADRIKSWLNPADVSYVETLIDVDEKKRLKILEGKFGKKLEPIAVVPRRFMPIIGKDIDDNSVYSSKAYFINHYLHHIDSTKVSDYNIMQNVLIDPDYIVETVIDNKSSYVFVKREGPYNCYIISFERENGKLILHKTFFTQLKKPYKKLARLFEILPEDATFSKEVPSIVHTVKQYTPSDDFMG